MYVVIAYHKELTAMRALMPEIRKKFPSEKFTINGSEEKGFQFRIEGAGDERAPRTFAKSFLKAWVPQTSEVEIIQSTSENKPIDVSNPSKMDDMLKSIIPKRK